MPIFESINQFNSFESVLIPDSNNSWIYIPISQQSSVIAQCMLPSNNRPIKFFLSDDSLISFWMLTLWYRDPMFRLFDASSSFNWVCHANLDRMFSNWKCNFNWQTGKVCLPAELWPTNELGPKRVKRIYSGTISIVLLDIVCIHFEINI